LILRGIKTVEYRSRPTRVIGRRFFIYASKAAAAAPQRLAVDVPCAAPDNRKPRHAKRAEPVRIIAT
jgi:hypothetical protein